MVEFADTSVIDLVNVTQFLHEVKPSTKDMFVFGIEKAQSLDQSVVFHLVHRDPERRKNEEKELVILSAQYIIDHPFWQKEEQSNVSS
jgi:hypothetical protein